MKVAFCPYKVKMGHCLDGLWNQGIDVFAGSMKDRYMFVNFRFPNFRVATIALGMWACLFAASGCSRGPSAVNVPDVDPAEAAQSAIELYDKDHDGSLSEAELAACPGILGHFSLYDVDQNKAVSQEEIEKQITELRSSRVGLTMLNVQLRLDGRPLKGAKVKLAPEPYLGEDVKIAWGTSNDRGIATMDIKDSDLPQSDQGLLGVHYGTYKIEITHPQTIIPEIYNTKTTLGYETEKGNPNLLIDLKSR